MKQFKLLIDCKSIVILNLILITLVIYSIRGIIFIIGAIKERKKAFVNSVDYIPFVSIVVPARNEEQNIRNCIESLAMNSYPKDKYEIIAVDDRSTDQTLEILNKLNLAIDNLCVVAINETNKIQSLKGKPGALQYGINNAKGEIILMTDADCIVGPEWIRTIVNEFADKDVALVASFTNVIGNKIFDKIQAVEWVYMHTMASAGVGLNQPLGCYGNNLSFRKKDFDALGGYSGIDFSVTEDLALLQAMVSSGKKIRYLTHPESDVDTFPCLTLGEYFKQHHRWAIGGLALGWRATVFIVTSASLWIGIILSIIDMNFILLSCVFANRILWDYLLIGSSLAKLRKHELHQWIPVSIIFLSFAELIIPFLLLKPNVEWKGQVFNKKH